MYGSHCIAFIEYIFTAKMTLQITIKIYIYIYIYIYIRILKASKYLSYVEHLFILASNVTDCISISASSSSVCVHIGVTSSKLKKYKSILRKPNLDTIDLLDSYFSHDEFASVNIVLNPETILKPM